MLSLCGGKLPPCLADNSLHVVEYVVLGGWHFSLQFSQDSSEPLFKLFLYLDESPMPVRLYVRTGSLVVCPNNWAKWEASPQRAVSHTILHRSDFGG